MKKLLTIALLIALASCGKDGENGRMGSQGPAGNDGAIGQTGSQGDKGEAGQDGKDSSIKVVQFCAGLVDSYGVAYSERGLCIEGKVYAVYSDNKLAALVELSPGRYTTTTPQGKNCSFIVDDNTCL